MASEVVGADLVELAPMRGFYAANFSAAHLAYKVMTYAALGRRMRAGR